MCYILKISFLVDQYMKLLFQEKIPKSNNTTSLSVPDLTFQGLVPNLITLQADNTCFEISIKAGSNEIMKLGSTYFKFQNVIDLSGHLSKIQEGDKLELVVKPKQAPKDIMLSLTYSYVPSLGSIYDHITTNIDDLNDPTFTFLADISRMSTPTTLDIKCSDLISSVSLIPKFSSDQNEIPSFNHTLSEPVETYNLQFDQIPEVRNLLKFYTLKVNSPNHNNNSMVHILAKGFKI